MTFQDFSTPPRVEGPKRRRLNFEADVARAAPTARGPGGRKTRRGSLPCPPNRGFGTTASVPPMSAGHPTVAGLGPPWSPDPSEALGAQRRSLGVALVRFRTLGPLVGAARQADEPPPKRPQPFAGAHQAADGGRAGGPGRSSQAADYEACGRCVRPSCAFSGGWTVCRAVPGRAGLWCVCASKTPGGEDLSQVLQVLAAVRHLPELLVK